MPGLPTSSHESAPCRIEWCPARAGQWTLIGMSGLAVFAVLASDLPAIPAWGVALLVALAAVRTCMRYRRQPGCVLEIPVGSGPVRCNGRCIDALQVHWRGPWVFVSWRGGDRQRQARMFWPGQLSAAARRELSLALRRRGAVARPATVAR